MAPDGHPYDCIPTGLNYTIIIYLLITPSCSTSQNDIFTSINLIYIIYNVPATQRPANMNRPLYSVLVHGIQCNILMTDFRQQMYL